VAENQNPAIIKPAKYVQPTNFLDFLKRQDSILRKNFLYSDKVKNEGINCTLHPVEHCYYVALIHSDEINEKMTRFSEEIAKRVPAVKYDPSSIHTTLANGYIIRDNHFSPNVGIIDRLRDSVKKSLLNRVQPLVYNAWLVNSGGVIASAYGNEGFFNLAYGINQVAKAVDLDLNFHWGAHMTVSRFSEARGPEQIKDLLAFVDEAKPLGQSFPSTVSLGTAYNTKNEFRLNEYDRFSIKD